MTQPRARDEAVREDANDCRTCSDRASALASGYDPLQGDGWGEFIEPCEECGQ